MRIDLQEQELAEAICEYLAKKFDINVHVDQVEFTVNGGETEAIVYV